jgi:hypothetical protein
MMRSFTCLSPNSHPARPIKELPFERLRPWKTAWEGAAVPLPKGTGPKPISQAPQTGGGPARCGLHPYRGVNSESNVTRARVGLLSHPPRSGVPTVVPDWDTRRPSIMASTRQLYSAVSSNVR